MRRYFVYFLASRSRLLYVGITNDLERRVWQHKTSAIDGFTKAYRIERLVYFEETSDVFVAIEREKQMKGRSRAKKCALIETCNPTWDDLAADWYDELRSRRADSSLRSE